MQNGQHAWEALVFPGFNLNSESQGWGQVGCCKGEQEQEPLLLLSIVILVAPAGCPLASKGMGSTAEGRQADAVSPVSQARQGEEGSRQ